ncbi:MAG TPA: anti-sigma factor [Terracidiphilus sp.]|jgi:anti-sigma-K factor RskA|nr:anti-sigma factor [Terracidiphilus sp.]
MNERDHIPQEDLTLYAMQALPAEETAAVRAHLETCAECRAELAAISGDLAAVALSVDQHAVPEGARQRFLNRISTDAEHEGSAAGPVVPITAGRPARRSMAWIPWTAVAALVILAVVLGMKIHTLNEQLENESMEAAKQAAASSHAQEVLDVLTAPAAQRAVLVSSKTRPEPTGRAVYLANRGGLIFQASNLDPLPENKAYELWVIPANGKAPIPAGTFRPDATGSASVVLPPLPPGVPAKAFGVTIERAEGSETPTAPIILSGAASNAGE